MIESFLTLSDGTLVDFAQDDAGVLQIRAGTSLTPSERPIVWTLTAADLSLVLAQLAEYVPLDDPAPIPLDPDDDALVRAMVPEVAAREAPIEFVLRPVSALHLAALLQIALCHPTVAASEKHQRIGRTFIEHVRAYYAGAPAVLEILRRGDRHARGDLGTASLAWLRRSVANGTAGHDCGEWWQNGVCQLCDRKQS